MAEDNFILQYHTPVQLTVEEIQKLADRLVCRGASQLSTYSMTERRDLIIASRCLRRLLSAYDYERVAGREIGTLMLCGGGVQ